MYKLRRLFPLLLLILLVLLIGTAVAETTVEQPLIDLTGLANALIALLGAVITCKLIPWIKSRTGAARQANLSALVKTLVYAAEQLYKTGAIQDRLAYVQQRMHASGYTVDRDAIEAAVMDLRISKFQEVGIPPLIDEVKEVPDDAD